MRLLSARQGGIQEGADRPQGDRGDGDERSAEASRGTEDRAGEPRRRAEQATAARGPRETPRADPELLRVELERRSIVGEQALDFGSRESAQPAFFFLAEDVGDEFALLRAE